MAGSCGVGLRRDSDLMWLWLWRKPAAVALIQPLVWEPPYAVGAALKRPKKNLFPWSSCCGAVEMNPTSIHEDLGSIPGLTQWVRDPALP